MPQLPEPGLRGRLQGAMLVIAKTSGLKRVFKVGDTSWSFVRRLAKKLNKEHGGRIPGEKIAKRLKLGLAARAVQDEPIDQFNRRRFEF